MAHAANLMAHSISGFIARQDELVAAARNFPKARVCPLHLGYGFLPLTQDFAPCDDPAAEYEVLYRLTAPVAAWAVEKSNQFPLAYVQTHFFGGTGTQCAVVWGDGILSFGPVETVHNYQTPTPLLEGAINRAVRFLGVKRGHARDEFEALALNLYRNNEDWFDAAGGSA
jgi:hypothetical protein